MTSDQELRIERRSDKLNITITYDEQGELAAGDLGGWFPATRRILIRPGVGYRNTLHTAAHELGHAELCHFANPPPWLHPRQEREADEYAARLLITPQEYRDAENAYGPHPGAIANELNTTVELVNIWRDIHERDLAS